jgi:tetratricopeptide (TPR) repeat protein
VELDDTLAEAHAALGSVLLWFDWNWVGAEREIARALQLNPNSVDALITSETYLALVTGRYADAAATSRRVFNLDPLNPFSRMQRGWVAFNTRRYDESIREVKSLIELYPDHMWGHFFLALPYAARHMSAEVEAECGKVMTLLAGHYGAQPMGICAWALGTVGETARARRLLQNLEQPPQGVWLDPIFMGNAYVGLGDTDHAVAWYQKGMEERSPNMLYMKDNVTLDPLRADPRFQALLSQMNFPR